MYVGVTLHYLQEKSNDLDLPTALTVQETARILGEYFIPGVDSSSIVKYVLKHIAENSVLECTERLNETMVVDGDHLLLLMKVIPRGFIDEEIYIRCHGPALAASGGKIFPFRRKTVLIGRDTWGQDFSIPLDTLSVSSVKPEDAFLLSRRHAMLTSFQGEFFLQDMGSLNGTTINNQRLEPLQRYSLYHGDIVRFSVYEFIFLWDNQEQSRSNKPKDGG